MANYGYIENADIHVEDFERDLKLSVKKALGEKWIVTLHPEFDDDGPVWVVSLPGTASETKVTPPNLPWLLVDDLDIGFLVAMQPGMAAFRHAGLGPSYDFARWAQGCIEEELAELWGKEILYDATNERFPPGTRRHRVGKGFRDFLLSQHENPTKIEAFIEKRYKAVVPADFW